MDHKKPRNEGTDRISSLPHHILHHILSFLLSEEVARTRVLSKTWNGILASYPILDFDESRSNLSREEFINHVDRSLNNFCAQNVKMMQLYLTFEGAVEPITSSLIKWLVLALEKGVEGIYIRSSFSRRARTPYAIKMSPLKFEFCSENYKPFDSLKNVFLGSIILDESTFKNLFIICPSIEVLELSSISGLKTLHIPKIEKLRSVSLDLIQELEDINIETDSIRELSLSFMDNSFSLLNLADRFPQLESLEIFGCNCDSVMEIISPSLKILELGLNRGVDRIKIDTPNLCFLKYTPEEFRELSFDDIDINAPCQWEIERILDSDIEASWFVELKNFLAGSKQVIKFTLRLYVLEDLSFSLEDAEEEINLPPVPVEEIVFGYESDYDDYEDNGERIEANAVALLNGLIWCCHPKKISYLDPEMMLTKFICQEFEKTSNPLLCCSFTHVKCWRHDLKEVKCLPSVEDGKIDLELTW